MFFNQILFLTSNFFDKNFWVKNNFWLKKIWVRKKSWLQTVKNYEFVDKLCVSNIFLLSSGLASFNKNPRFYRYCILFLHNLDICLYLGLYTAKMAGFPTPWDLNDQFLPTNSDHVKWQPRSKSRLGIWKFQFQKW